jgi:hypothetical protein
VGIIVAGCFEKLIGSDDISLDESVGACDGAINVTLGRQMNDGCGLIAAEDGINRSSIADISFLKYISRICGDRFEGLQVRSIRELVDVNDGNTQGFHELPTNRGTNKPSSSSH